MGLSILYLNVEILDKNLELPFKSICKDFKNILLLTFNIRKRKINYGSYDHYIYVDYAAKS